MTTRMDRFDKEYHVKLSKNEEREKNDEKEMHIKFFSTLFKHQSLRARW